MQSTPRVAWRGLAGTIALGLLLAGCVAAGPAPAPTQTATVRVVVEQAPTATALVPAGVATPRPDQQVRVTDHFVLYYTADVSPTHVENVARYLEAAWRDIPPFLGLEPPTRPIRVYVGLDTPRSTGSPSGVIVINWSSPTGDYTVIPHELTHVVTGYTGPQWMEEGLAQYMQERFPAGASVCFFSVADESLSIALLQAGKWVSPWEFPLGMPTNSFDSRRAYWESGSFVKYLIETYGLPPFWEMHDDASGWVAAERAYGKDIDALIEEWRQHLASSTIPPEHCPECIASFLEASDQWVQLEQVQDTLSAEARDKVSREFSALSEALCRKDAQAMQGHLETVRELLAASSG